MNIPWRRKVESTEVQTYQSKHVILTGKKEKFSEADLAKKKKKKVKFCFSPTQFYNTMNKINITKIFQSINVLIDL